MAMDAAEIERLIKDGIPCASVTIEDLRGDGDHYAAHVTAAAFAGKTRIQQHQMVYLTNVLVTRVTADGAEIQICFES